MTESANPLWLTAAEAAARGDRLGLPKDATRAELLTAVRLGDIPVRAVRDEREWILGPGEREGLDLYFGDLTESAELSEPNSPRPDLPEGTIPLLPDATMPWSLNMKVVPPWLGHLFLKANAVERLLDDLRELGPVAPAKRPGRKPATYWEPYLRELARFVIYNGFPDQFPPLRDHLRAKVDPHLEETAPDDNQLRRWAKVEIDNLRAPL